MPSSPWLSGVSQPPALIQNCEEIVLSPHHPLWHPRRTAGVDEKHVVTRAAGWNVKRFRPGHTPLMAWPNLAGLHSRRRQ